MSCVFPRRRCLFYGKAIDMAGIDMRLAVMEIGVEDRILGVNQPAPSGHPSTGGDFQKLA
jgi:hypothetical protein